MTTFNAPEIGSPGPSGPHRHPGNGGEAPPPALRTAREFARTSECVFATGDYPRAMAAANVSLAFASVALLEQHEAAMSRAERIAETLTAVSRALPEYP